MTCVTIWDDKSNFVKKVEIMTLSLNFEIKKS